MPRRQLELETARLARRIPGGLCALLAAGLIAHAGEASSQGTGPTFDCAKASGQVEQLICKDAALAALDRRMAVIYEKALKSWPAEEAATQRALQRGWIKGRNDCWKADDPHACVELAYRTRLVEIQIESGELVAPTPVAYACQGGEDKPFSATFYRETDPPSAVLTYGNDQVIAFLAPSGSGAKYAAANMEFWEHHGEAMVDWFGTRLTCTARRSRQP
jgi:uncharacterized protein